VVAVTNFGTLAILALPKMPERQLRLLLALETVPARSGGWREVKTDVLASQAGPSVRTACKARAELARAGRIEYRPGTGPGHPGRYRLLFETGKPPKKRSSDAARDNPGNNTARDNPGNDTAGDNPGNQAPGSLVNGPQKPTPPNALTSDDPSTALEPLALDTSALRSAASDPRMILGGLKGLDLDDDEITFIITELQPKHADLAGYLLGQIGKDDGARLAAWIRRQLGRREPDHRPWCQDPRCDHGWIEADDGKVMHCPNRHQGQP
jgi:hypothetical protein